MAARDAFVRLGVLLEDPLDLLGHNADAGIHHAHAQRHLGLGAPCANSIGCAPRPKDLTLFRCTTDMRKECKSSRCYASR